MSGRQEMDAHGRKWLHLAALQTAFNEGQVYVEHDGSEECVKKNVRHRVYCADNFYIGCDGGRHYLASNSVGYFVGFYGPFKTERDDEPESGPQASQGEAG